jgi:hypothetical protein
MSRVSFQSLTDGIVLRIFVFNEIRYRIDIIIKLKEIANG